MKVDIKDNHMKKTVSTCKIRVYLRRQINSLVVLQYQRLPRLLPGIVFAEVSKILGWDPRSLPRQLRQFTVKYSPSRKPLSEASPITNS